MGEIPSKTGFPPPLSADIGKVKQEGEKMERKKTKKKIEEKTIKTTRTLKAGCNLPVTEWLFVFLSTTSILIISSYDLPLIDFILKLLLQVYNLPVHVRTQERRGLISMTVYNI